MANGAVVAGPALGAVLALFGLLAAEAVSVLVTVQLVAAGALSRAARPGARCR